jgi:hypothetical protein
MRDTSGTINENDKRSSPRFQAKRGDYIIYIEGTGTIRDLSVNGMFVLDTEPLPVDTTIRLSLRLGDKDVALQGIVRRTVAEEGMGIQFTGVSPEARRRLRLHIASLASADRPLQAES